MYFPPTRVSLLRRCSRLPADVLPVLSLLTPVGRGRRPSHPCRVGRLLTGILRPLLFISAWLPAKAISCRNRSAAAVASRAALSAVAAANRATKEGSSNGNRNGVSQLFGLPCSAVFVPEEVHLFGCSLEVRPAYAARSPT